MTRLDGGTYHLVCSRTHPSRAPEAAIYRDFRDALDAWSASARTSPLFALNGAKPPLLGSLERAWLLFAGPVPPDAIEPPRHPCVLLSYGLFNLVFISATEKQRDDARSVINQHEAAWEEWEISRGIIARALYSEYNASRSETIIKTDLHIGRMRNDPSLTAAVREYAILLAAASSRAARFCRPILELLARFDGAFSVLMSSPRIESTDRHRLLVLANAALSRHASQNFSGTSPVLNTEGHYWTHSLLGVGVAGLALLRVYESLEDLLSRARLMQRLRCLTQVGPSKKPLTSLDSEAAFWRTDHLFSYPSQQETVEDLVTPVAEPLLPLVTCFSGRDGFRSTEVSLMAPLEVVSSCNTVRWTLMTLTHEFSHRIIDGFLGQMLPDPTDDQQLAEAISLIRGEPPANLFSQVSAYLCFGIWRMGGEDHQELTAREFGELIQARWADLTEILTHCFDFLYFYSKKPTLYVTSVWASWGVIPNIRLRIRDYIVRSLAALHTTNLPRSESCEITVEQLQELLAKVAGDYPDTPYVSEALSEVKENREYYTRRLGDLTPLVRIVRHFLYSEEVARLIEDDPLLTSGRQEHDGYPIQVGEFVPDRVKNPLRFIEAFTNDRSANPARALWILQMLAFRG